MRQDRNTGGGGGRQPVCTLPADAHELLASVADLLGPNAEFRAFHEPNAYQEDGSGFGCGCEVLITHSGEIWNLHRGDSTWSMARESKGKQQPGGSATFSSWIDLDPTPTTSHLVAEIRRALGAAT
ncbi:hypothetical protein [Streptomyces sp. gb14]|uniref:hypothetical protein n=1 Tax=Streptomyces sp. gb14 TaxID=1827753 RepID=UPI000BEFAAF0|nr:hypothetical protein [Streptomyces sp. gb14]